MKNHTQKLQEIANQKKIVDAQLQALDRKNKNINHQKIELEDNFLKWVKAGLYLSIGAAVTV